MKRIYALLLTSIMMLQLIALPASASSATSSPIILSSSKEIASTTKTKNSKSSSTKTKQEDKKEVLTKDKIKELLNIKNIKIVNPDNAMPKNFFKYKEGSLELEIDSVTGKVTGNFKLFKGGDEIVITEWLGTPNGHTDVIIPAYIDGKPVTTIATSGGFFETGSCFKNKNITSVIIPNSVNLIGKQAFSGNNLTSITIPNSVVYVGSEAFSRNKLTSVTLPDSIKDKDEVITNSFSENGYDKEGYKVLEYNDGKLAVLKYTGEIKEDEEGNRSIVIPEKIDGKTVTAIGTEAFGGRGLTSVTLPNSLKIIGNSAFENNKLTSVTIPDSVSKIGYGAFFGNKISKVTLPKNLKDLDTAVCRAFLTAGVTYIDDSYLSSFAQKETKQSGDYKILTYNDKVAIVDYTGYQVDLTIPEKIDGKEVGIIGGGAFFKKGLDSIKLPSTVKVIGEVSFSKNKLTSLVVPNSVLYIENGAFLQNNIASLKLGNSVKIIGGYAFYKNRLDSIIIPKSVEEIKNSGFEGNRENAYVTLPPHTKYYEDTFKDYFSNDTMKITGGKLVD